MLGEIMGIFGTNVTKLEKKGDIDGLIKATKKGNPQIKKEAIEALKKVSDNGALVPLFSCCYNEDDNEIKGLEENAIVQIAKKTGAKPLVNLLESYAEKERDYQFDFLVRMLIKIGDIESVIPLFEYTQLKSPGVFGWPITTMVEKIGGDLTDSIMREILSGKRKGGSIDVAARYFARKKDISVVPNLIELLQSVENEHSKQAIAYSLGEIGDKRAVDPLIEALADKREKVASSVVSALGELNDKRAIEPLKRVIEDEKSHPGVRAIWGPLALRKISE